MPKTSFRPQTDGFSFTNSWTLDAQEQQQLKDVLKGCIDAAITLVLGPLGLGAAVLTGLDGKLADSISSGATGSFGLCGGMAQASLDYYRKGWIIQRGNGHNDQPTHATPEGGVLRDYIWRRLIDSLRDNGAQVLGWMALAQLVPDFLGGGSKALLPKSRDEFNTLKNHINAGQPWPITLIGNQQDPFHNHQVLAYGYEDPGNGTGVIYVYDNNGPDGENTISLDFRGSMLQATMSCTGTSLTLRGFFCNSYAEQTPPIAVGLCQGLTASAGTVPEGGSDEFRFTARNYGFGPSPALSLYVAARVVATQANVDIGGETTRTAINPGQSRQLIKSGALSGATGKRRFFACAYLGPVSGVDVWKVIPQKDAGTTNELFVDVGGMGGWQSLGGVLTSAPAVGSNKDGRLEVFVKGSDNALYHIWQTAPNNGWSGWGGLGGVITTHPAVNRNADGRLEVFARGSDNALYHIWQTAPNSGWSGWAGLGGVLTSAPAVGANKDGRLEVFVKGSDNALYHIWQTAPNSGWSGWAGLGGGLTSDPAVAANADGRLECFVRGTDGALYHIWQTAPNSGWSSWAGLGGGLKGNVAVGRNQDGRLECFVRGTDDHLYHIWQTAPNSGWSGWAGLGGVLTSDPVVGSNQDGRLEVFVRGTDGKVWHIWQTAPNSGWSGWAALDGALSAEPAVGRNADGRLEVFLWGTNQALWHRWQVAPNSGWNG